MGASDDNAFDVDEEYRLRNAAYDCETAEHAHAIAVASARQEGHHALLAQTMLRRLICRFGTLHEEALVHLACASIHQLKCATEALSGASNLTDFLVGRGWPIAATGVCSSFADSTRLVDTILTGFDARARTEERRTELRGEQYSASHCGSALARARARALECILLKLAQKRFGDLPEWAKQRLDTASSAQHSAWIDELLDAPSLEALLTNEA